MKHKVTEYTKSIFSAVLIALLIRAFLIEAYKIPTGSMIPTGLPGDHLFVNKFIYGLRIPFTKIRFLKWKDPERGDVVVFLYPLDESKNYIKRVVGLPGDRVQTDGENLLINGEKVAHTVLKVSEDPHNPRQLKVADNALWADIPRMLMWQDNTFMDEVLGSTHHLVQYSPYRAFPDHEYVVPPDHLFVMGDNRDNSQDSREWGFMPMDNLKGKAMFIWLSCGLPLKDPQTGVGQALEAVRSTISNIPVVGWLYPCDGHWLSVRWDRFGKWMQ